MTHAVRDSCGSAGISSMKASVTTNSDRNGIAGGTKGVNAEGKNNHSSFEVEVSCNDIGDSDSGSDAGNESGGGTSGG